MDAENLVDTDGHQRRLEIPFVYAVILVRWTLSPLSPIEITIKPEVGPVSRIAVC